MGGKGGNQPSKDVQQGMQANQNALVKLAEGQAHHGDQLYDLTEPGLQTAEERYQSMASGDPAALMRAINPAVNQIGEATTGERRNILENSPAGGERNLALEMADVNAGSQIGGLASQAYINAPNALGSLAGQGVGESISATGTGIGGYNSANSSLADLGKIQTEQKGGILGALGSLANAGATLGAAFA